MKSLLQCIFEAGGKPSDIKKYKEKTRTEKVRFKTGDIYDFSDEGYDEEFKYYEGTGNGYIKDKEGHVYDVYTYEAQGDAGRIAGGSTRFGVTIKRANGKDDFTVSGYMAVFSNGRNLGCVDDIKNGYYLEDYIAKYYNSVDHGDKFKELAEKGDKNAKSYTQDKAAKKAEKRAEFQKRYLRITHIINWEIADKGFEIIDWFPYTNDESKDAYNAYTNAPTWVQDEFGKQIRNAQKDELYLNYTAIRKRINDDMLAALRSFLEKELLSTFKTSDINKLKGISGSFLTSEKDYERFGNLAIDTKTKKLVVCDWEKYRVLKDDVKVMLNDFINIDKNKMSPEMEKLFKTVAAAWMKLNKGKQGEYIEANWKRIQSKSGSYWNSMISKNEAIVKAKTEYQDMLRYHDWDKQTKLQFSLSLIKDYIEGDLPDSEGVVEKPLENPEQKPTKERGKNTKMSDKAEAAAYDKMKAWHEGKRKQNVANSSDAKLKMNYKICKELGYDKEAELLKAEADKRGIDINEALRPYEKLIIEAELKEEND